MDEHRVIKMVGKIEYCETCGAIKKSDNIGWEYPSERVSNSETETYHKEHSNPRSDMPVTSEKIQSISRRTIADRRRPKKDVDF